MTKLRTLPIGGVVLCALASSAALAADIPVKALPPALSFYNWTGIYVGGHAGYGVGMKDWVDSSFDFDVKGFLGGGQIGINQQVGNWVFGLEADASWANITGSQSLTIGGAPAPFLASLSASTSVDRLATVAGRLGFAQDRLLVYVKGGVAWVHENHAFNVVQTATVPGAPALTQTAVAAGSETRFGPMIGIGAEHALWGNWSVKSEYNYLHLPHGTARLVGTETIAGVTTPFTVDANIRQAFHLVKFGLNYRFGPEAPPSIAPSRPAPGFDWTGFYVGAQAGYGFGRKEWPDFAPNDRFDVNGWHAGGTVGTNVQAGVFVFGVESEWLWANIQGSSRFTEALGVAVTQTTDLSSKVDWLSLSSLRFGFVAADRWLVYLKGGVALAHETHTLGVLQQSPGVGSVTINTSGTALHTGYLAGIGVEHAFLGNWSAKVEYNYINFRLQDVTTTGSETVNIPGVAVGTIALFERVSMREEIHLVKFGVSYHFSALPQVVSAKY